MNLLNVDTKLYHTKVDLQLSPKISTEAPNIIVAFDNKPIYCGPLAELTSFYVENMLPAGEHCLSVEFTNKKDEDTDTKIGMDKAVVIDKVTLNDISSPKFAWAGIYEPKYPEPWYSQQVSRYNAPDLVLKRQTYLGWNGKWSLTFTTPVFTWMHNIEDLGWIYG